jgi:hypothetical protein
MGESKIDLGWWWESGLNSFPRSEWRILVSILSPAFSFLADYWIEMPAWPGKYMVVCRNDMTVGNSGETINVREKAFETSIFILYLTTLNLIHSSANNEGFQFLVPHNL